MTLVKSHHEFLPVPAEGNKGDAVLTIYFIRGTLLMIQNRAHGTFEL